MTKNKKAISEILPEKLFEGNSNIDTVGKPGLFITLTVPLGSSTGTDGDHQYRYCSP
jgi:hypothetical protein